MGDVQTSSIDMKTLVEALDPETDDDLFPVVYEFTNGETKRENPND